MFDFNDRIMLHTNNKRFISRLSLQDLRSMCHFYVTDNEKYLGYKEVHTEAGWCQVKQIFYLAAATYYPAAATYYPAAAT